MKPKTRIYISTALVIIGGAIILWFILRGIFVEGFINYENKISLDNSAKFGDFIGGFVGVIFTLVGIVLLYETLALQRKEFEESRQVFERQQFENKFFSLIKLYHDIIMTMHYDIPNSSQKFTGKEYFIQHKKDLFNSYSPTSSFYKNRKIAIDLYTKFYISNKETVAHYFRTLYRIFRLIDNTNFNTKNKESYAKIVRAQLSESELFFINYNACTSYGKKFRELIINYNITKHLPILERIEFKEWKEKLTDEKVNSINVLFNEIIDFLRGNEEKYYKTYLKGRFAFLIKRQESRIDITITRNNTQTYSPYLQEGYGLDDFSNSELEKLMKCWVLETIFHRNYDTLNKRENLDFRVDTTQINSNKSKITCYIKTKNNTTLKIE